MNQPAAFNRRSLGGFASAWGAAGVDHPWWNVVGVLVLVVAAVRASSVALAGFGLDSLIEIGASTVVLWELSGTGPTRQRRALRLIGAAFLALAAYLLVQSVVALVTGHRAQPSAAGMVWTAVTAAVMFALAAGKTRTGREMGNPVLATEGRVAFVDGLLATAVLVGVAANAAAGWWWADPAAGLVIVYYALAESPHLHHRPGRRLIGHPDKTRLREASADCRRGAAAASARRGPSAAAGGCGSGSGCC